MNDVERNELMNSMAHMRRRMEEPERGQTTFETLRDEIARLADAIWQILEHSDLSAEARRLADHIRKATR